MTTTIYFGDLRTGKVIDTIDPTGLTWEAVNNDSGSITGVTVQAHEVRRKSLRAAAQAARTFLAVDVDGVLQQAGPLWARDWDRPQLTLGAGGLWSLWDHRMVVRVLAANQRVQTTSFTPSPSDLGGIARQLVNLAMTHTGGSVPLVHSGPVSTGDRTETFQGYELPNLGDELRQLTRRQINAPDMRFRPRWVTGSAALTVEWVMEAGTEAEPLLVQIGEDWFFDQSVPRSPVEKITTKEDASLMGSRGWVTGNGMEQDILIGTWNGISSMGSWLWDRISGWASDLLGNVSDFFGIASPSKKFAQIGRYLMQGMAVGIDDQADTAVRAAMAAATAVALAGSSNVTPAALAAMGNQQAQTSLMGGGAGGPLFTVDRVELIEGDVNDVAEQLAFDIASRGGR